METACEDYDRAQEVKQFDQSKHGVKGLVDSGLSSIPRMFIHPPETLQQLKPTTRPDTRPIPTIDLSAPRSAIVHQISGACRNGIGGVCPNGPCNRGH